ncbi:unnamed protein product [Rhizoctonia solani]|uniref:GATA-type domain-containing protein n=1 Tax=Rhizoctonia solani TaxID=456999 RepID=A0A8H3H2I0_9AGAM|nr:unnamed protein product [Rhizoctonia solani]CAE7230811.1 unnamed protein product [Rhizoctonia solani]
MDLKLPSIRDLNLYDDARQPAHLDPPQGPVLCDKRMPKVLVLCKALCSFAEHYGVAPPPPNLEALQMVDHAVEVITLLQDYKLSLCPPSAPARPPKRPWEDTTDEVVTPRPAPLPPAKRISPPASSPALPTVAPPPAQEAQMSVFDGLLPNASDKAKSAAIHDVEAIRTLRTQGTPIGKVKYRKRSRANPLGNCHSCKISHTPEWRRGPDGQRTLCNACGLHYAKLVRKRDRLISSLPIGAKAPPPIDIEFLCGWARIAAEKSALGRRHKDKSKTQSPIASSKAPSTSKDDGHCNWQCRDKETEPAPQYAHALVTPSYTAPPVSSSSCPPALMPTTLPAPPQTLYAPPVPVPFSSPYLPFV